MKISVLGATGLIGQHTARAVLAHGQSLRVVHRAGSKLECLSGLDFEAAVADLDDREALIRAFTGAEAVIHCAGYTPRQPDQLDAELAIARRQMENFCQAALAAGCSRVVYVSAASVLNKPAAAALADESMLFRAEPGRENPFRWIKWHLEQIAEHYIARGLPLVYAIPSMVFGAYDQGPTAGKLIVGIANGTIRNVVACQRNIIAGPDVAEGLLRCLEAGKVGERYLLAGSNITLPALAAKIAAAAGVPPPKCVPLAAALVLAWLQHWRYKLTGRAAKIKLTELRMLAAGKFLATDKATRELGFTASTPVDTAIADALVWFRQHDMVHNPDSNSRTIPL